MRPQVFQVFDCPGSHHHFITPSSISKPRSLTSSMGIFYPIMHVTFVKTIILSIFCLQHAQDHRSFMNIEEKLFYVDCCDRQSEQEYFWQFRILLCSNFFKYGSKTSLITSNQINAAAVQCSAASNGWCIIKVQLGFKK